MRMEGNMRNEEKLEDTKLCKMRWQKKKIQLLEGKQKINEGKEEIWEWKKKIT